MFGIAAGGEGVGLLLVDHIDARHRQAGALGETLHDAVKFRRLIGPDLLRVAHAQHHLVAVPVGEQVHAQGNHQRQYEAGLAAQEVADDQEERGQRRQEQGRAKVVHGRKDGSRLWRIKAGDGIMQA
jgi:hypothetical protein